MRHQLAFTFVACVCMAASTRAAPSPGVGVRTEQETVRQAVQAGQIKPLAQIVTAIQQRHAARVVELEMDQDETGRHIYELKLLDKGGRVMAIKVDAATGAELPSERSPGAVKPLAAVLRGLLATTPGHVLEAELELGPGTRAVYEVRIINADGRLREVSVDARSGGVLEAQSKHLSNLEKIKPMVGAIEAALARYPADVVDAELEMDVTGRRYYEMELRLTDGRRLEVHVDAETLAIVGTRGLNN